MVKVMAWDHEVHGSSPSARAFPTSASLPFCPVRALDLPSFPLPKVKKVALAATIESW